MTLKKYLTNMQTAEQNTKLILAMTGISRDELNEAIFNLGMRYLHKVLRGDEDNIRIVSEDDGFWNQFRRQWNKRDRIFIHKNKLEQYEGIADQDDIKIFRNEYSQLHTLKELNFHPNRFMIKSAVADAVRRAKQKSLIIQS